MFTTWSIPNVLPLRIHKKCSIRLPPTTFLLSLCWQWYLEVAYFFSYNCLDNEKVFLQKVLIRWLTFLQCIMNIDWLTKMFSDGCFNTFLYTEEHGNYCYWMIKLRDANHASWNYTSYEIVFFQLAILRYRWLIVIRRRANGIL